METELLRLFNAVLVEDKNEKPFNRPLFERAIKNGFILSPVIGATSPLLDTIESVIGISGEKANAAFHKSWSVVKDSSLEQLVIQQIVHYITTYGFERLGIFSNDSVYIPHETLELPEITADIPLTVIKAMTEIEICEAIVMLGNSGIALSKETLSDIMKIIPELVSLDTSVVYEIKNRELKALLYDFYNLTPIEPTEYLRYVVRKLTGESLLIKNKYLIEKIKASDYKVLDMLLGSAPDNLASIFFRFKPLFLAMKSISHVKPVFNRLRKDANRLHSPMPEDYLNNITSKIKNGETFDLSLFDRKLADASIFRKIRLAYALNSRLSTGNSTVYKVRNGRGWATDFEWDTNLNYLTTRLLKMVVTAIAGDMVENVSGKIFYVPASIHYALPATEKQFLGNIPANSYVSVPRDLVIGVHWTDDTKKSNMKRGYYHDWSNNGRVDLDLSLMSLYSKYGWDGYYRSTERDIMFSGDMTSAPKPNGASEFFYLKNMSNEAKLLYINYFNFRDEGTTCKFIVASEQVNSNFSGSRGRDKAYMVDVNNILVSTNIKLTKKQNLLGMIIGVDGENRVYFTNTSTGDSISSRNNDVSKKVNDYMARTCQNIIELSDVLLMAGAIVVSEKPEEGEYIDLSPENLDKSTIIKLLL
jgi:predicted MarR family transcription regulator